MKQRRHLSNKLSATVAASILAIALTGVTCGTFAWFTYETRAKIDEFQGVTIGFGELELGFRSEVDLPSYIALEHHLIKDTSNPNETIYWFDGHNAGPETLRYILEANGYATDTLHPVTTSKYSTGDDLTLFSAPRAFANINESAKKEDYIYLPLVFRYRDILEDEPTYISNENIYLSNVTFNNQNVGSHIHEAVRIFTNDKEDSKHLITPFASEDGSTNVGGALDLNKDGYYDLDFEEGIPHEHIYGQVTQEPTYKYWTEDSNVPLEQRTTFTARHKENTYGVEHCVPEVAENEGFYNFRNKHEWVTTTNPETNNYAYLDLSIFVEGWDRNVIDSQKDLPFSMELKFEVVF